MLKTVNISDPFIAGLHAAIAHEFDCRLCHIIGPKDDTPKFVAIFVLRHFYSFFERNLAVGYNTGRPFVPTIVTRMQQRYGADEDFRNKVHRILNFIEHYEDGKSDMVAVA